MQYKMCIRDSDRYYVSEKGMDTVRSHAQDFVKKRLAPVSYTHLDVYKRQEQYVETALQYQRLHGVTNDLLIKSYPVEEMVRMRKT